MNNRNRKSALLVTLAGALLAMPAFASQTLLNVSYDVSRNVYKDLNPAFAASWQKQSGDKVELNQSHGGSSKQARSVIDGLEADVVTMNNALDIDAIAKAGLLGTDWAKQLPSNASPSWSTILFLVRKGNPKGIKDWDDLVKPGVSVVIPNPKTSGNGRYSYLAAWQYAATRSGGTPETARAFVGALFSNVPVLDTGGRGATTTFSQRGIGDVLLTFENELQLLTQELGGEGFEIVVPSLSVRADNPVAVVEKFAGKHGTGKLARAYLDFHYSPEAQEIFARNGVRPGDAEILAKHANRFPALKLFTVEEAFGSWPATQKTHFADGGLFDQIYSKR